MRKLLRESQNHQQNHESVIAQPPMRATTTAEAQPLHEPLTTQLVRAQNEGKDRTEFVCFQFERLMIDILTPNLLP